MPHIVSIFYFTLPGHNSGRARHQNKRFSAKKLESPISIAEIWARAICIIDKKTFYTLDSTISQRLNPLWMRIFDNTRSEKSWSSRLKKTKKINPAETREINTDRKFIQSCFDWNLLPSLKLTEYEITKFIFGPSLRHTKLSRTSDANICIHVLL